MNVFKLPTIARLSIALLLTSICSAQGTSQADSAPVYQVEVLIFLNVDQSRTTQEIPRASAPAIADVLEQDLGRSGDLTADGADRSISYPSATWAPVSDNELLLNKVAGKLSKTGAYQLLAYRGWVQTLPSAGEAYAINLVDLGIDPAIASGKVKLFQKQFLHLAVDIALGSAAGSNGSGLSNAMQAFGSSRVMPAIVDSRRIRLERLVYFDQPQFGVIAMVARSNVRFEAAGQN